MTNDTSNRSVASDSYIAFQCNESLAHQRLGLESSARTPPMKEFLFSVVDISPAAIFCFGGFVGFTIIDYLCFKLTHWYLASALLVLSGLLSIHNSAPSLGFPTALELSDQGFRFSWDDSANFECHCFSWKWIRALDAERITANSSTDPLAGVSIVISMRIASEIKLPIALRMKQQVVAIRCHLQDIFSERSMTIRFPLDSLAVQEDRRRLISMLQQKVNSEAIQKHFAELMQKSEAT